MKPPKTLGMELHATSNLLDRCMNAFIISNGAEGVTPMHGMILKHVSINLEHGCDIYQKDIETEFDIARSTVTATLKLMEKKGYIRREGVAHDARLKSITLTPLGEDALIQVDSSIQQSEAQMRNSLSEQEYQELLRLLDCVKSSLI